MLVDVKSKASNICLTSYNHQEAPVLRHCATQPPHGKYAESDPTRRARGIDRAIREPHIRLRLA